MLANSKPAALTLSRIGREIAVLCDKHSVPCGAPEDLAIFLGALDKNKLLAMEFWSLVARATERNPHATTDRDALLTAIVEAVTAQTLAEFESAGATQRLLVRRTAGMLAGEDIHAPLAPGPFAAARDFSDPTISAKPEPESPASPLPFRKQQLRLVLNPEPPPASENQAETATAAPIAIPLSAYADAEPERRALPRVLVGVLLLALISGACLMLRGTRAGTAIRSTLSAWTTHPSPPPGSVPPSQPIAAPETQPTPVRVPQAQAPVTPPPTLARHTTAALPPEPAITPATTASTANDRTDGSDLPETPQVVVPESLMRQNLISSRFPIVPDPAAAHGIVVLQAVITSRGTVEHLRAIEGDPALRRAAIDAASTWRYRPYLLNGTPVDVSTTISVDFSGND